MQAKDLQLMKAVSSAGNVVPDLKIVVNDDTLTYIRDSTSKADLEVIYGEQAKKLAAHLLESLPEGVTYALITELLIQTAEHRRTSIARK